MTRVSARRCLLAVCSLLLSLGAARAENWPQWRGPNYDGNSKETNLPTEWSEKQNVLWTLKMPGIGSSTPAVWDDRLFLTSADGDDLVLLCVSTAGKELWKVKVGTGNKKAQRDEGNSASPSPSTDGKHVFAFFGSGDFGCYDFDGKEVWKFNAQDRYGKFDLQYGLHTTPLLYGDRLYLPLIHSKAALVVALDKANGKEVWKVERKSDGVAECEQSYASPTLWRNGKEALLIVHGNDYATGHRLDDGSEVWRVGDLNPKANYNRTLRFVASPVCTPDLVVVPSAKNGPVVGIKPDAKGAVNTGSESEVWRLAHGTPDVPTPVVYDGLVYLCGEGGNLTCLDAKTGKQLYSKGTHSARHRASPVYADGKVYLTARDGTFTVAKAGPEFKILATNTLPDQTTASPAISGGRIYIRGWDTLYAIGQKEK